MKLISAAPARILAAGLLATSLSGGVAVATSPIVSAAPVAAVQTTASVKTAARSGVTAAQRASIMRIAASKHGAPYRYGASGPNRFDCSGFTSWTYRRVGKSIPRTANQQYRASRKISRSQARPGDLVFFGGRHKTHVGIYAGGGKMWHAPRTGDVVKLAKIRRSASFGRY